MQLRSYLTDMYSKPIDKSELSQERVHYISIEIVSIDLGALEIGKTVKLSHAQV